MTEKQVENYFTESVRERLGGKAYKFVSPGNNGVPDRLVCLPDGRVCFVELKAPGKLPRPMQIYQIGELRKLGQSVYVLDSKEHVDQFVEEVMTCNSYRIPISSTASSV